MKYKLLQILLGAVGSAITVLITYLGNVPAEAGTIGVALGAGPVAAAAFGSVFRG